MEKAIKKTKTVSVTTEETKIDLSNLPSLPETLTTLQFLRTAKNQSDSSIHTMLDKALAECKKNDCVLMLERIMLHIGDVARQHNLLSEMGIKSSTGGSKERSIFRSCLRWWEKNLPASFKINLHVFVEFTLYENLMYYQNKSDRKTGKIISQEIFFPMHAEVWNFLQTQIRQGKDLYFIARHLPKYYFENVKVRTTKKIVKLLKGQTNFKYRLPKKAWVKINGEFVTSESGFVTLNAGDIISYPRGFQKETTDRQAYIRNWIEGFCKVMGWSNEDYRKFRSTQNTPEQAFCSNSIKKMSDVEFDKFLNKLTTQQKNRVSKILVYKDKASGKLVAKDKWKKLGEKYIVWEENQGKIGDALRKAAVSGDTKKTKELLKDFKIKSTGLQTLDILVEIVKGDLNDLQINNLYQSLIEKMSLIANVFPIVDGSDSMSRTVDNGVAGEFSIPYRDIVYAMCIAFSTRNPVEKFRDTFGWFSKDFKIMGKSTYLNNAPNQFVDKTKYEKTVPEYKIISAGKTFTENLEAMRRADTKEYACTNMFSNIEFFVSLVKDGSHTVEELPVALLYLTDNENNTGLGPKDAITLAASIGWHPLQIFWGISQMPGYMKAELDETENCLYVGGFEESALSQILSGIKRGSINPQTELWSIYNDPRYSVLNVA